MRVADNHRNADLLEAASVVDVVAHVDDTLRTIPVRRDVFSKKGALVPDLVVTWQAELLRACGDHRVALRGEHDNRHSSRPQQIDPEPVGSRASHGFGSVLRYADGVVRHYAIEVEDDEIERVGPCNVGPILRLLQYPLTKLDIFRAVDLERAPVVHLVDFDLSS